MPDNGEQLRPVLGRRPLLVVWAVAVGLLFRTDSPYRYAEAGYPYPWGGIVITLVGVSLESFTIYLLLRRTPAGKTRGIWLSVAAFAALFVLNIAVFVQSFHSPAWHWLPSWFAMLGLIVFAFYAIGLEIVAWVRRRRATA